MDDLVDKLSSRLASFEKHTLKMVKELVNDVTLPPNSVFADSIQAFGSSFQETSTRNRIAQVLQQGVQTRSDVELNLGAAVAQLGNQQTVA
jgi:hypothetical protein